MVTTLNAGPDQGAATGQKLRRGGARSGSRNWLGGLAGWIWLLIVVLPIYWIVITSFKSQSTYFAQNPMVPPTDPTLANYRFVIESHFIR
ncbi:MAG TPA: carbohydrate ABC transporter permease, partial [Dermatophilaceae bacterium]|nr:carbohydrate ABC transporter permease [Dermatophilaceae bacterium]